jgi:hypothetical protein
MRASTPAVISLGCDLWCSKAQHPRSMIINLPISVKLQDAAWRQSSGDRPGLAVSDGETRFRCGFVLYPVTAKHTYAPHHGPSWPPICLQMITSHTARCASSVS